MTGFNNCLYTLHTCKPLHNIQMHKQCRMQNSTARQTTAKMQLWRTIKVFQFMRFFCKAFTTIFTAGKLPTAWMTWGRGGGGSQTRMNWDVSNTATDILIHCVQRKGYLSLSVANLIAAMIFQLCCLLQIICNWLKKTIFRYVQSAFLHCIVQIFIRMDDFF